MTGMSCQSETDLERRIRRLETGMSAILTYLGIVVKLVPEHYEISHGIPGTKSSSQECLGKEKAGQDEKQTGPTDVAGV